MKSLVILKDKQINDHIESEFYETFSLMWLFKNLSYNTKKQGGKGVLVLPNTKHMTRSTKWVWLNLDNKYVRKKRSDVNGLQ